MSVPFSNTHLRVPRGFGTVLEGLAREVLRDQPDDIPAYAAQYFDKLLKQREESGLDPAEWAARLEDRFYNNHAFRNTETAGPEKETAAQETSSKEKSNKCQTEDESSHSGEDTTKQSPIPDQTDSAESKDDEENNDPTDKLTISHKLQHTEKTSGADKQSDEQNGTEKKNDFKEVAINPGLDSTTPQLDLDLSNPLSAKEISNADMWEVGASEYEGKEQQDDAFEDKEIVSSEGEEDAEVAEPVQSLQYFAHGNVDICASELGGIKRTLEDGIYQDDAYAAEEEETMKYQLEETDVELPPSQYEIPQENHQEADNHAQKPNERETTETEASYEETSKSLAHSENSLDNIAIQKEDSLVEMSFEDVPEDQCITVVLEKNSEEDASMEVALINLSELPQKDDFKELTTCSTVMVAAEYQHKTEMEIIKREVISEEEELQSYPAAFDTLKDNDETNNLNYSNDGERELSGKTPELATKMKDHENEHIEEIPDVNRETEEKKQSNEQDDKEDETTDKVCTEGYTKMDDQEINNSRLIQNPSQLFELYMSVTGIVTENETLEENQEHLPQPNAQSPKTNGESQSEDVREEKWDIFKQEEEMANSEVQEQSKERGKEETITPTGSADWTAADHTVEERPAAFEKDTSASANKSDKACRGVWAAVPAGIRGMERAQEECSRPQEEEDIMDIPLDDPEANRAAAKIQAGFRGHMTRKKMKPEDKTEGEEVSSTGDVLHSSQGGSETGRSGAIERDDTSVPEQ
ncbi:hypothetical protein CRENBAI_005134 [Crenichthys baileyi]|uniref:RIIa domain-containing protein n=2 Tax=Goodeidae TaxID=28758 RepID=A0AAV9SD06_9TELE